MPWRLSSDVEEYAEHTADLLARDPAVHTIPLTVLERLRAGRRWSGDPMLFGWFEEGGEVRGAIFRTPPFELLLAVVPEEAIEELVEVLRASGASFPGVNGEDTEARRFAEAWTTATGERGRTRLAMDLYELGALRHPEPPPVGRARAADEGDLEIAVQWYTAFQQETHAPATEVLTLVRERMDDRRLWLWEDETGAPVSLAARTAAVGGVARIAPVYTPGEQRRHGYATAVAAACTADALDRDADRVVLFTDLADPSANAMYQRIGFRRIGGRQEIRFD